MRAVCQVLWRLMRNSVYVFLCELLLPCLYAFNVCSFGEAWSYVAALFANKLPFITHFSSMRLYIVSQHTARSSSDMCSLKFAELILCRTLSFSQLTSLICMRICMCVLNGNNIETINQFFSYLLYIFAAIMNQSFTFYLLPQQ